METVMVSDSPKLLGNIFINGATAINKLSKKDIFFHNYDWHLLQSLSN